MTNLEFLKLANGSLDNDICGVYFIFCPLNGKIYVGSSKNIKNRIYDHMKKLRGNYHFNQYLQHTYNKYGKNSLQFMVLEECESREQMFVKENYYLSLLDKEFRLNLAAVIPNGEISLERRKQLSESQKGRKSGPLSEEHKRKVSEGLKGRKHPPGTAEKISKALLFAKSRPTYKQKNYKLTYEKVQEIKRLLLTDSDLELAAKYNISRQSIQSIRKGIAWKHVTV